MGTTYSATPPPTGVDGTDTPRRFLPPAVLPAIAVLAAVALARHLGWLPPPLAVLLAAGGVALGGRAGLVVAAFAAGLLAAAVQPVPDPGAAVDVQRPVEVVGRVVSHGVWSGETWSLSLRPSRVRQGRSVRPLRGGELRLTLPGTEPPPPFGSRLRLRGYLSRSPGYANALPVEPGPWRMWVKSRRLLVVEEPPGRLARLAVELRRRVEQALAVVHGGSPFDPTSLGPGLALVRALVLGDSSAVPARWKRGLRRAGLIHVLAVSGLHVGLVAVGVLLLTAPLPMRARMLPVVVAVGLYLLLVGPRPALLRASLMALLAAAAILSRRPPLAGNALAVAAAVLVLHRPSLVGDVGFQLTVGATAGLVFLAPRWAGAIQQGSAWLERAVLARRPGAAWACSPVAAAVRATLLAVAAALGAQVAAAPLAWPTFHLTSLTSPLTNLVAVPWTALFLGLALLWTGLAALAPSAAAAATGLLDVMAAPFGWPSLGGPGLWGTVPVVAPRAVCWLLVAVVAVPMPRPGPFSSPPGGRRWRLWLLLLLALPACAMLVALAGLLRWGSVSGPPPPAGVSVTLLDVGQGDAILLRDRERAVLVDGGGWRRGDFGQRVLLPALLGEGVTRLDAVVLTHPDRDHCGGLVDLASYLPVGEVWSAVGWESDRCLGELVDATGARRGGRWRRLASGDRLAVGEWRFRVLHPLVPVSGARPARNDRSLVLAARARGRRLLLTGDVEAAAEREILRRWRAGALAASGAGAGSGTGKGGARTAPLAADILKVAHHGSRSSSGRAFLAAVEPRVALVSAGVANPYGHPAPDVVGRLRDAGATVLRTDLRGFIRIEWRSGDGWVWTVGGREDF